MQCANELFTPRLGYFIEDNKIRTTLVMVYRHSGDQFVQCHLSSSLTSAMPIRSGLVKSVNSVSRKTSIGHSSGNIAARLS